MQHQAFASFIAHRAKWVIWLCAAASMSAPASRILPTGKFAKAQWALELVAHGQWVYMVTGGIALILLLSVRRPVWPIIPALMLSSSFLIQSATLARGVEPPGAESALTIGTANLNFDTTDFRSLTDWLLSADAPDVVFLQEFTSQAQNALKIPEISVRYPYRVEAPQPDQFGLALLSRHPLTNEQKLEPQDMRATLRLRARLTWNGKTVQLSALHPMPPLDATYAQIRDQSLIEEAKHLTHTGGLALMAGDFNNTPWVRGLFDIDAQMLRASGFAGTWPNAFGWLSILPLDHVLASSGWQLLDSRLGPDLRSDHRPVVVRLRLVGADR